MWRDQVFRSRRRADCANRSTCAVSPQRRGGAALARACGRGGGACSWFFEACDEIGRQRRPPARKPAVQARQRRSCAFRQAMYRQEQQAGHSERIESRGATGGFELLRGQRRCAMPSVRSTPRLPVRFLRGFETTSAISTPPGRKTRAASPKICGSRSSQDASAGGTRTRHRTLRTATANARRRRRRSGLPSGACARVRGSLCLRRLRSSRSPIGGRCRSRVRECASHWAATTLRSSARSRASMKRP